jgi:hypothetical protein
MNKILFLIMTKEDVVSVPFMGIVFIINEMKGLWKNKYFDQTTYINWACQFHIFQVMKNYFVFYDRDCFLYRV